MTFYLATFLLSIPSPVSGIPYAEAWAVLNGLAGERPFLLVGLAIGAGQVVCHTTLFFLGDRVLRFLPWARRAMDKVNKEKLARHSGPVILAAAFVAIPPLVPLAVVAPAVGIRFAPFIVLCVLGRWARFAVLCAVPATFADLFPREVIPDWLLELL